MKSLKLNSLAFAAAFFAVSLSACHNHEDGPNPQNEITIEAPSESAIINAGTPVTITGTIKGKEEIHGYQLIVRQKSDNKVIFTKDVHEHAASITINQTFTLDTVARHKEVDLEVLATLDHDGNTMSKKVMLHALPAGVHNEATITISAPTNMQMFNAGQTVTISATISGLATMHGYKIFIRNKADNSVLYTVDEHVHEKNITVSKTWAIPAGSGHMDLELEITSALDHDGNLISKKVDFHVMP